MDDVTRIKAPSWEPRVGASGRIEIGVNYFHENGRPTFDSVPLSRYIQLFEKKALDFQIKGKPMPEYCPSLERAREELEKEEKVLKSVKLKKHEGMYESPPLRDYTVLVPVSKLSKKDRAKYVPNIPEAPKAQPTAPPMPQTKAVKVTVSSANLVSPKPKPPVPAGKNLPVKHIGEKGKEPVRATTAWTETDRQLVARNMGSLTRRDKEVVDSFIAHGSCEGLAAESLKARISGICTLVGIPTTNRFGNFDRIAELRASWAIYKGSVSGLKAEEEELLSIFRLKDPRKRFAILKYAQTV